jgi:hypothetical protein
VPVPVLVLVLMLVLVLVLVLHMCMHSAAEVELNRPLSPFTSSHRSIPSIMVPSRTFSVWTQFTVPTG